MTLIQIIVLALIQGLTEFLPVSSSAHLILGSRVFGWPDQGLVFDVATHLGTLLAVVFYFRRELSRMVTSLFRPVRTDEDRQNRSMLLYLGAASVATLFIGFLAYDMVAGHLRDLRVIAWATIGFGILLWVADAVGTENKDIESISIRGALLIGLAQACALIPGTSRSGVTITAGRLIGLSPDAAARFSFLLSIPVIAAAGGYGFLRTLSGEAGIVWGEFLLATFFAALAGWVCIAAFLALLKRVGLKPFIIYRLSLGVVLLWIAT
jgi:undecaprenyl-diphosphatase